jgi:hypothetical protein
MDGPDPEDGLQMQAPPPPMMNPMMSRNRMMGMLVYLVVGLGLLFLMVGATMSLLARETVTNPPAWQADWANVWGPAAWNFGMFLFLGGLIGFTMTNEHMDPFVRLFLMVILFVAILLVLVKSLFVFG